MEATSAESEGNTLLNIFAAVSNQSEQRQLAVLTYLMKTMGADPNTQSDDGMTPLMHLICGGGFVKCVELVLNCGGVQGLRLKGSAELLYQGAYKLYKTQGAHTIEEWAVVCDRADCTAAIAKAWEEQD